MSAELESKNLASLDFEPLILPVDTESYKHPERVEAWQEYRTKHLTEVDEREAARIYGLALSEVASRYEPPEGEFLERLAVSYRFLSEAPQQIADRLWAAGYLFQRPSLTTYYSEQTDQLELVSEAPATRRVIVWKVKKKSPRPPESPHPNLRPDPGEGITLGATTLSPAEPNYPAHLQRMLSDSPFILVDRATRDGRNWMVDRDVEHYPYFEDHKTESLRGLRLTYVPPGDALLEEAAAQALERVNQLDDTTSDVWRFILWKATERRDELQSEITLDSREVARALGYKPHVHGGMKPEHLLLVHQALQHLEALKIFIPPGERLIDTDGKKKKQRISTGREERIIAVMARTGSRDLYGQRTEMIWEIALGKWVRLFSSSYAPMFKALVELPSKRGVNVWAKRIGTELVLYYRQSIDKGPVKRLRWRTLLERSMLANEVEEMRVARNTGRVIKYAEGALDLLQKIGVIRSWEAVPSDADALAQSFAKPGSFEAWMDSMVEIVVPIEIEGILDTIKRGKPKKLPAAGK
ncbi:hypothetical protein GCM10008960_41020 [Deinococcus sedimenti]|uniref:Uncharacterized protein n=1 Tax=Deinococcus sedimenti TaxID=1867090 RepID=A0ABQ2S9C3_9DEIO|nr:hypothetical protein GCM10008960_41020 [Deinococcus sedimenti]